MSPEILLAGSALRGKPPITRVGLWASPHFDGRAARPAPPPTMPGCQPVHVALASDAAAATDSADWGPFAGWNRPGRARRRFFRNKLPEKPLNKRTTESLLRIRIYI